MTRFALFWICIAGLLPGLAGASPLTERLWSLPPDSTEVWIRLVKEGDPAFRAAAESLLATADLKDPGTQKLLAQAGSAYCAVTRDSVLLADLTFLTRSTPKTRRQWSQAVEMDRRGYQLRLSDPKAAVPLLDKAIALYGGIRHLRREAVAWGTLGTAYSRMEDWARAGACYQRALVLREQLGDPLWIGRALNTLGSAAVSLDQLDSALVYYERARVVRERIGYANDLALTLAYLGNVYFKKEDYPRARRYYLDALAKAGPGVSPEVSVSAREGLANVLTELGDLEEAASIYREVLTLREAAGDPGPVATTRGNLATVLTRLGDHAGALAELDRARATFEASGDASRLAEILNKAGNVHIDIGNYEEALALHGQALKEAERASNHRERVRILLNLGFENGELGATGRALDLLREAKALADSLADVSAQRDALSNLATVHEKRKEYVEALQYREEALAIDRASGNRDKVAMDLGNRGLDKMWLGRDAEGRADLQAGLLLALQVGNPATLWKSTLNLADAYELAGDLDSARVLNDRAIQIMESVRIGALGEEEKAEFLDERSFVYEAQVNVLGKLCRKHPAAGYEEASWTVAERGKAQALLDMLREARLDLTAGADSALLAERSRLEMECNAAGYMLRWGQEQSVSSDSLAGLRATRDDRESALSRVEERLRLQNPRLAELGASRPADLAALRTDVLEDPSTVLLEYVLGDSGSYVWTITRERIALHPLAARDRIQETAKRLRRGLERDALRLRGRAPVSSASTDIAWDQEAAKLYTMILEPAAPELAHARSVLLIPDGVLQYVPFELLIAGAPAEGGQPHYALSGKTVRYAPSCAVLMKLAERRLRPEEKPMLSFLGVGDPVFTANAASEGDAARGAAVDSSFTIAGTRSGLDPLPHTRTEVTAIQALFKPNDTRVLLGKEASEKTLTEPGFLSEFRILHFATHGLPDERSPMRSSLALSYPEDPSEDGYLQASEIVRLHLAADLVVLSACETGKGKMVRGEGVLGLPRAFFYAGARNVLVSLWSVSDEATADLMTAFYQQMIGHHRGPALALSLAKNQMIQSSRWSHPFYWAGFVLMGPG
jgi:CHAT domain-containing protein